MMVVSLCLALATMCCYSFFRLQGRRVASGPGPAFDLSVCLILVAQRQQALFLCHPSTRALW